MQMFLIILLEICFLLLCKLLMGLTQSVTVLDNASIHHVDKVVQTLKNTGVMVHFLPPYCPDLNPVEEAFSKVKSILKSNEGAMDYLDTKTAVLTAITEYDCKQWIMHAGY